MSATGNDHSMSPVDSYLAHLAIIGHPTTTISTYRCVLRKAIAEMPGGLLSDEDEIEQWLATRRSASTRAVYRAALRSFYAWAHKRGKITWNPAAGLAPVKVRLGRPRPVPMDQIERILTDAREPVRLWALIALYGGARCIEISRLRREDVTEQTIYLHGKGDRERVVPTHPELWTAIRDRPPGLIAQGRSAHYISDRGAVEFDHIGLPEVTMHRLRHTAGTRWHEATGNARVTQELLGHTSLSTVQVYAAVSDQSMRTAVLAMPSFSSASTSDVPIPGAPAAG